jgi:hypothetical protein
LKCFVEDRYLVDYKVLAFLVFLLHCTWTHNAIFRVKIVVQDLKEIECLNSLKVIDLFELNELELVGEEHVAHYPVKTIDQMIPHDILFHHGYCFQREIQSHGKELGNHVEIRHDCEAI